MLVCLLLFRQETVLYGEGTSGEATRLVTVSSSSCYFHAAAAAAAASPPPTTTAAENRHVQLPAG